MKTRKNDNCIMYSPNGNGQWYIGRWDKNCSPREYLSACKRDGLDSGFHRMTDHELEKHKNTIKGWFPGEYQII